MAKKTTKKAAAFVQIASFSVAGWPSMGVQQRETIKIWLRHQCYLLESSSEEIGDTYRARHVAPKAEK